VISAERAAKNESTFRDINEKLEQRADELELGESRTPYLCECHEERCTQVVLLTRDEYERVRAKPRTFVLVAGHQAPSDAVVEDGTKFVIVQKTGDEGPLVEQRYPR
jgi:hypothetical protein